jgi:hypothetical protein
MFPIKNDWKQGDALSPMLFNLAVEYAIQGGSGKPGGLESQSCTLASSLCRCGGNILGGSIYAIEKNIQGNSFGTRPKKM